MYYRQPRYFSDFHCIGPECVDNCCYGWRIDWTKKEVDKLKSAPNISAEFRELIEKTFVLNEKTNLYKVKLDDSGKCPMQTSERWCRIQRELGVEYMSYTCMTYPRNYVVTGDTAYRCCNMSCREIAAKILSDEKCVDLVNLPIKGGLNIKLSNGGDKKCLPDHPEIKYRSDLFEFFYDVIGDKKHDVETNIILGALAAQTFTKLVESKEIDRIPEALKTLRSQMHNGAQLKTIENIKPNYHLRFGFINNMLKEIVGFTMSDILNDKTGTPNIDLYNLAHNSLTEIFKERPFYLRNIALELLLELQVPFKFTDKSIFENYSLFAMAYACIKLNMISIAVTGKNGKVDFDTDGQHFHYKGFDRFVGLTSIICRNICQNIEKQKAIIDRLNENGFTTPAYIALLVK